MLCSRFSTVKISLLSDVSWFKSLSNTSLKVVLVSNFFLFIFLKAVSSQQFRGEVTTAIDSPEGLGVTESVYVHENFIRFLPYATVVLDSERKVI